MKSKLLIAMLAIGLVSGCANMRNNHYRNPNRGAQPAKVVDVNQEPVAKTTAGLGEERPIAEVDQSTATDKLAPHQQVYYFDFDTSNIHANDIGSIDAQAKYLMGHPGARIVLYGNTDERGSREYNVALGERRAQRISEYLRAQGVSSDQIRLVSYGEEKPASFGHDESAYHLNRRVELKYEETA